MRASASGRTLLQDSLSLATIHQLLTPNFLKSCNTPSIYLTMSRPTLLLPSGLDSIILRGISLLLITWMCPAHLSLPLLIVPTISDDLYSWYNSWLYLSCHSPFFLYWTKDFPQYFSFSATGWSLVQRSPAVCLNKITKPQYVRWPRSL
jgi:hypothetical protein